MHFSSSHLHPAHHACLLLPADGQTTTQGEGARQLGDRRNSDCILKVSCTLSAAFSQFVLTALAGFRVHSAPAPAERHLISAPNGRAAATRRQGAARLAPAAPRHALLRPLRCSTPALPPPPSQSPPELTMSALVDETVSLFLVWYEIYPADSGIPTGIFFWKGYSRTQRPA